MICVLDIKENGFISDWYIGTDTHDVRRQIETVNYNGDARLTQLAEDLYRREFPPIGRYYLDSGYVMLVSP